MSIRSSADVVNEVFIGKSRLHGFGAALGNDMQDVAAVITLLDAIEFSDDGAANQIFTFELDAIAVLGPAPGEETQ